MNSERLLDRAIELARSHEGQFDEAGKPYIGHPLRVMNSLETVEEKIVGILHDTIEDSDLTFEILREFGFSKAIVEAIDSITKRSGEDYETDLDRVTTHPIALKVKIADLKDNLRIDRIPYPTEKDRKRLKKYQAVLPRLLTALAKFS
jgi:GTP diphosphokinase / guanosine-3',5'-bis(diphosphate) 3'-diphosphatase